MYDAAGNVPRVAPLTEVDVEARRRLHVLDGATQQADGLVALPHEHVPESVSETQDANRTDRVGEQRVGAVEGMNETASACRRRPARRLYGAGYHDS